MPKFPIHFSQGRLRTYLAAAYALFIVYASLSPFSGWRTPNSVFSDVLTEPLLLQYTWLDVATNLFAYLPFGLLLALALRARFDATWTVLFTALAGAVLSTSMEYVQMYLPTRISSNLDILTNSSGTALGALLAVGIAPQVWFTLHLMQWRYRMFHGGSMMDFGLALVVLWMFAQINPSLPMLNSVFISTVALAPLATVQMKPFIWMESVAVALNLLMLGLLLLTLLRKHQHAVSTLMAMLCLVALVKFGAAAILLKSWALLLWLNSEAVLGIFIGILLLIAATRLSRSVLLWCAAIVTLTYLVLAHWILDSSMPATTRRMYQWDYGHLLNYNDLSQFVAFIFPLVMLGYLWRIKNNPT